MVGWRLVARAKTATVILSTAVSGLLWLARRSESSAVALAAAASHQEQIYDAWARAKHKQQAGLAIPLADLASVSFEIDEIIVLDMRPYHTEYWTADLNLDKPEIRVPIYPQHNDPGQGVFYCPSPGQYTLRIRIPVPKVRDGSRDPDPPTCYPYRGFPDFWGPFMENAPVRRMIDFCGTLERLNSWTARYNFEGNPPPDILGYNDSLVYTGTVTCIAPAIAKDEPYRRHRVKTLAAKVYGNGTDVLPGQGVESLGYWRKDGVVGKTAGSISYQPQPEHCPQTFQVGQFKSHQENCKDQDTVPTFRWTPYHVSRGLWILTPAEIHKCLMRPIRFYGDSIMHQSRRGLDCLARGYGGLEDWQYRPLEMVGCALDFDALFPPRDAQGHITDAEIDRLLQIDQFFDDADYYEEDVLEVWSVGMWVMPGLPMADWSRGIHRWLSRLAARADGAPSRPFVTLLTSPASEPSAPTQPGWQTADRAYLWNKLVLAIAPQYDIEVVDTFWPTVHRHDARADNAHHCGVSLLLSSVSLKIER